MLTGDKRALEVTEETTDEIVGTESDTEIATVEIEETEETEENAESAEDPGHHITARRAGKAKSIPTPAVATTEPENGRTDTVDTVEETTVNGTAIEVTEAHLVEMNDEIQTRGLVGTEICLTTAEVAVVVAAADEEAAVVLAVVAETVMSLRSREEGRVPRPRPKRRNQPQT